LPSLDQRSEPRAAARCTIGQRKVPEARQIGEQSPQLDPLRLWAVLTYPSPRRELA
jgi:hypothetical protein